MIEHVQVFADSPNTAAQDASRRGDTRTGADKVLLRWIVATLAVAVVVRFGTWVFSWFGIGPVSGMAYLALVDAWGSATGLSTALGAVELTLAALAVGAAVVVAAGVRMRPERWRRPARVLGWALAVNTAVYLASILVSVSLSGAFTEGMETYLAVALLIVLGVNLALIWTGRTIARLAGNGA